MQRFTQVWWTVTRPQCGQEIEFTNLQWSSQEPLTWRSYIPYICHIYGNFLDWLFLTSQYRFRTTIITEPCTWQDGRIGGKNQWTKVNNNNNNTWRSTSVNNSKKGVIKPMNQKQQQQYLEVTFGEQFKERGKKTFSYIHFWCNASTHFLVNILFGIASTLNDWTTPCFRDSKCSRIKVHAAGGGINFTVEKTRAAGSFFLIFKRTTPDSPTMEHWTQ